jgi:hypothetical protein
MLMASRQIRAEERRRTSGSVLAEAHLFVLLKLALYSVVADAT